MVDINLIGEEESRQQNYSGESGFGQGINLDNDAPAAAPPGGYGSDFSDLSTGSGNAKLYVILGALVIVIAAVIYFLIPEEHADRGRYRCSRTGWWRVRYGYLQLPDSSGKEDVSLHTNECLYDQ